MLTQKLKRNNCRICSTKPAIHERAEPTGFLNSLLLAFQTGINGKSKSQGVQRHQERQKQRLESTGNGDRIRRSSDQKAIARNTPKRHHSNLSKRRRSDTPADNSSRNHNDQKLFLSVLGFDPMSLWGLVVFLVVLFSGKPGFTAGRGFSPAGGAPGGG
ncbi:phosphoenolpyruvate carboxykinase [Dorcoceras hygrometricum]|uniref:Phosphoenolpyruvate carboxykinase n=1 Tax=Dorcoceras hygrometricum TaxID=472368 RepID=A0A2Z7C9P3_9LAMI|nr:phosphoenolpyruvate carboxykinase [Dorcoceras hygrometricum]